MSKKSEDYKKYLESNEWHDKAAIRMQIDNYRCQGCGSKGTAENCLQVHHFGYRNIGNENILTELVTLCKSCHSNLHRIMCRTTGYYPDGSPRHGWAADVPDYVAHITADIAENGKVTVFKPDNGGGNNYN